MSAIKLVGRTTEFKGKSLWEILGNLKNFGLGRVVVRSMLERFPEKSFFRVLQVETLPSQENRKMRVLVEKVFRGRKYEKPVWIESASYKTDYRLLSKKEEIDYCKIQMSDAENIKLIDPQMEFPPLLKEFLIKETGNENIKLDVYLKRGHNKFYRLAKEGEKPNVTIPMNIGTRNMILRSLAANRSSLSFIKRTMSDTKALVVGINVKQSKDDEGGKKDIELSAYAKELNEKSNGSLLKAINSSLCDKLSGGKARLLFDTKIEDYAAIAVTSIDSTKWDNHDGINADNEAVRIAASSGVKALQSLKIKEIYVDDLGSAKAAAEGSILGSFKFQPYKSKKSDIPNIHAAKASEEWIKGAILANAQNFCKTLMDTPANLMTPTIFCDTVREKFNGLANVDIQIHDEEWAKKEKMNLFLSVTRGSSEPPKFLEITYSGDSTQDLVALVGKGITFDSGGISLKPSSKMDQMRGDMGGAANVVSTIWALASLKVPINVKGFVPLCENMPGNKATKPGDVFFGRNGRSVCIDNTDAEGRLILADALSYASDFKPRFILDIATLTGAVRVALGDCVTAIFSNSDPLWDSIHAAGKESGDRVWRMPLYTHYTNQITEHDAYDLNNLGKGKGAGSCVAAAFLREFVPKNISWLHADIAGVMSETSDQNYVDSSMTGRPVRTIIEFLIRESKK